MKKNKKEKKTINSFSSKDLQLPIIQRNIQNGNLKESNFNTIKSKNIQKPSKKTSNLNNIPQIPQIPLAKSIEKDGKPFGITNISQSTNKTRSKSGRKKKIYYYKDEINPNEELIKEDVPRISEEKLSQIREQRKKRLHQAKLDEEKELEIYSKLIEEYKNNINKRNKNLLIEENSKIPIISSQKAQKILEEGGMLDAYKYVLYQLCRIGLPTGNVFDYSSYFIKKYEKKWKEKKSKMLKDKIDKYYEEKQKEINNNLDKDGEIKKVNKSLEHREEYKFIKNLDKSRSKRNIIPRVFTPISHDNLTNFNRNINKNLRIMKEAKTSLVKDDNIPYSLNLKKINIVKNNEILKKNINNTALSDQYKNNKILINNNLKEIENSNIINNKNSIKTKKKK